MYYSGFINLRNHCECPIVDSILNLKDREMVKGEERIGEIILFEFLQLKP